MRPGRIEVEIEELVLHGFAAADAGVVRDAVQRELESSLRDLGGTFSPADGSQLARVDGGQFAFPRPDAKALGAGVATCIGSGLAGKRS